MDQGHKCGGFTLLELMVAIAVVGILSSLALPSYHDVMQRAQRTAIQLNMLSIHMQQQQYYIQHGKYAAQSELTIVNTSHFTLSVKGVSVSGFTIVAKSKHAAVSKQTCAEIELNHIMEKTPADCW